jgi:NAD(P)H-dependent FMN reductase
VSAAVEHSYNRRLLAAAARELPDDAVFLVFEDIDMIPPYNEDIDARETPVAVQRVSRPSRETRYRCRGSISPYGATLAQAELRRVLKVVGAHVLEAALAAAEAHNAFAGDGRLVGAELKLELASLVQALVTRVSAESSSDWELRTARHSD